MKPYSSRKTLSEFPSWPGSSQRAFRWIFVTALALPLLGSLLVIHSLSRAQANLAPAWVQQQTNTGSPWWQGVNIFRGDTIPPEMDNLINVVGWGRTVQNSEDRDYVFRQVERIHTSGGWYVGNISVTNADYETYPARPELLTAVVLDVYGHPISFTWESTPDEPSWYENTNHPVWQAYLLELARAQVDSGVDGIILDGIAGTAGSIGFGLGGSFGEPDMTMFREYLSEMYTPQELLDQFGIEDIGTFNYKEYIHDLGMADQWLGDQQEDVPFYDDFVRFQRRATVDFMSQLTSNTKNYAQMTYGREIVFTGNLGGLWINKLIFADLLEYITSEYPYHFYGYPPDSHSVQACKLTRALGNKPALLVHSMNTVGDFYDWDSTSTLMTIHIAEAYASSCMLMVPYRLWGPDGSTYDGDMAALAPVYRFIKDNTFAYEQVKSLSEVALLYSMATDFHTGGYHDNLWGLNFALLDSQVQHDIVALGDDIWLTDTFSSTSLAPYSLVFLPEAAYLSDSHVDTILSFVAGGGAVVAWGEIGIYDETGQQVEYHELAPLTVPGTHAYGDGWFITVTGDLGESYRQTHDPAVRQQLVSLVNDYADGITASSAEHTLSILAYEQMGGSRLVAHLINNDYITTTDQVQPTDPFTVKLNPPSGFLDQTDIQVYALSPHRETPSLLTFTVESGHLIIDHPGVSIYDVLVILPEGDALVFANEMLNVLTSGITGAKNEGYDTGSLDDLLVQVDDATAAGNHLLARQLGRDALQQLHTLVRPRILFDEAHDEKNTLSWERALEIHPEHPEWYYFGALAAALEEDFVIERNPDVPISHELLQDYEALILAAPREMFDTAEESAVNQFVSNGGGLLVLADNGIVNSLNPIVSGYGMTFDRHDLFAPIPEADGSFIVDTFVAHSSVPSISFMETHGPASLIVESPAVAIAFTDEDTWRDTNNNVIYDTGEPTGPFVMVAVYESDQARVAAVADNAFQDEGFQYRSNDLLMSALLKWVTHWHPLYTDYIYLPVVLRRNGE